MNDNWHKLFNLFLFFFFCTFSAVRRSIINPVTSEFLLSFIKESPFVEDNQRMPPPRHLAKH